MEQKPAYLDESLSFKERAKDLVSRMTLKEKISQMLHQAKPIPRLGVPRYTWWNEALHGVARAGVATSFPQAIGMAAAFDTELMHQIADVIATEGRAKFNEFFKKGDYDIYKGLTFWSPNVNIFRDPRWGRGHETYGEDPHLTGRLGVAYIKGLQGDHPTYMKAAACAKHFAVHSGPEDLRHEFNAVANLKDMYETYLPAFKECVVDADVEAVMGAYNRVNGEPACGSKTLLVDILREDWNFQGHVVSDCWAIKDFHEYHKVTSSPVESVALAVNNGCDLNCGNMFLHLETAVEEGLVTEETITRSVERLMETRMKLGLFDDPSKVPFNEIPYEANDSEEHRAFAIEVSKKTLVLLKNENNLLPLDRNKLKSIAVIGPNADSRVALIGNYFGTASRHTTVLEGIREAVNPDTRVYYAEGCHLYRDSHSGLADSRDRVSEAISAAERADVVVMCMGLDSTIEGEEGDTGNEYASGDKHHLNLPGIQQELLEKIHAVGKPVVLVLLTGSALAVTWADEHIPAIINAWYPGADGGKAIASLLFGDYSPSAKLPVTFYRSTEELPEFTDYAMKNRTYRYMTTTPLYPFGYGLSYTKFAYEAASSSENTVQAGESVAFAVKVKNIGNWDSEEAVQLYVKDVEASVDVPHWQLKGFRKVFLKAGEELVVEFEVTPRDMALIDEAGRCRLEPGAFEVYIGGSQPDERSLELTGTPVVKYEFIVEGQEIEVPY